jgi:hypothetical protein
MRRRPASALFLLLAAVASAAEEPAAPIEVRAHVRSDTVPIGTPFRYTVEVVTGAGVEVLVAQPSERIGDFDILDFGIEPAVERAGRSVLTRWYSLVGWTPGHYLVPSPPVQYRLPGTELREAPGHEIRVSVESVLAQATDATDIRDIKGPEPVPVDWRPYWLVGGGVAAVVALGFLLHRVLNRPRRARPAPPPRPPHEIAAQALAELRRRRLIEAGAFKEFYSTLSGIVRTYLEQRFRVRAPEMTTEEFLLASARDGRLHGAHRRLLGEFLAESDLVKFARHLPTVADSERAWEAAERFVRDTARAEPVEETRAAG